MSSSSTVKSSSSSTSHPHNYHYDVFLSFRGADTRKTFTDHLYDNLVAHGIHTFRDGEELENGGHIPADLDRAMEESRFFIIVFSKTYATSEWCLNQLLKITECTAEKASKVIIPIFYHVTTSEVGNQEGSFKDAFLEHRKNADPEKLKLIGDWEIALKKVSKIKGVPVDDQHEAKVIRDIREDILKKLDRKPLHVGDNIVGVDVHLKRLKSLLKMELNEVHMVGIYGIGGIGKTTIAMTIYNDISSQFDGCCFLRNIGRKDEDGQLELQKTLLQDILKGERPKFSNTKEGINVIKERLCSKNVLIVLDDVVDIEQLKNLAGEKKGWYGKKSRIIITTKNTQLLRQYDVMRVYKVEELNHEESTELFNWWAFKRNIPQLEEGLESLSQCVIEYAKGLPIALEVLGGFLLGNKNKDEWRSALHKLEKTPDQKVQSVLRVSYDRLENEIKSTFLDIACFFKGEDKDFVSRILGRRAKHEINVLCQRCLITILENKLYMHDLLQQMGHEIIRQKYSKDPERSSRFWDADDVVNKLTSKEGTKRIEGLFIDINSTSRKMKFTTKVFKRMSKLRLLKVYNWFGNEVHLPMDFEFPSSELTYMYWDGYPLESLPTNFDGTKLVELNLMYGSIKQLWERNKILDKLKVINLSYSKNLIKIPDFSTMPYLVILILEGCTCLESLPENFYKLKLLRSLSCDGCSKLKSFPEIGSNMTNLREINLSKTAITEVPSLIRRLHGLEDLNLSYCKNLASLPDGICSLSSLRNLRLDWCLKLKDLPEMKAGMKNLERLDLSSTAIKELPSSIGHLKALKHLDLSCCENLVSLPESICNLRSLETLYLLECSGLKGFPEIRSDMKNLKILDLQSTGIKELPSSLGRLPALEHLYLSSCKHLASLPETICNLSSLKTLCLPGCSRLRSFPEIKGSMKSLTTLDLESSGIKELPSSIGRLRALEHLYLSSCKDLVNLPESICDLSSLKTLHVSDCSKLHGSKLDLGGLQCLEDLQLSYISCEWGCLSGLCSLRSLHLSCCSLKNGIIKRDNFFSTLKSLVVNDCNLMEGGIPSDLQHLIKISIEQNRPLTARGSSSRSMFGRHESADVETNGFSCNKRNSPEQSPSEEHRHKRFRGSQG